MHLSSTAQWWDEWQLRILVLGSLGLQWFLVLAAPMRKYSIPLWLRRCIQLGSGCSDAVAIYALATVFNRHANGAAIGCYNAEADVRKPPSMLEVLWAPVLLIHLGGVEEVSTSNIDDNTLWIRQTVSLLSQVTIAIFGFYKSWPGSGSGAGDRRMLASAVLLFILGILSVLEKPLALRGARVDPLMAESRVMKGGARVKPSAWWKRCFTELDDRYKCWKELPEGDAPILSEEDQIQMILSDLSLCAAEVTLETRAKRQQILAVLDPQNKDKMRRAKRAFELMYTRANVISTPAYLVCHVMLVPSLYIAAIMLFAASRKHGYGATDVKTTYILLCFTAVLDVFGLLISELMYRLMSKAKLAALCENIAGHNLLDLVLRTVKRGPVAGSLLKLNYAAASRFGYSNSNEGKDQSLYRTVSDFITVELVKVSEKVRNTDFSSYRSFTKRYWSDTKKENLLNTSYYSKIENIDDNSVDHKSKKLGNVMIWRSLRKMPFDTSVLIWHIATDLCFRTKPPKHLRCTHPHADAEREVCTEAISNYMAYLLNFHPDMLMTGSRQHLFTEATEYMESILTSQQDICEALLLDRIKQEARKLVDEDAYTVIHDACTLAEELLNIENDDMRWSLMYLMWVGMLCYSASMCRGYLHAKSLGEGGEFLSYVWFIISLKGVKTLADKLQMPDKEQGDDDPHLLDQDDQKPKQDLDNKGTTMPEPEWRRAYQPLEEEEHIIWGPHRPQI